MIRDITQINKFTAYKSIASDYDTARELIRQKSPVNGEAITVQFYYPSNESVDRTVETMLGIGGLNGSVMIYSNILGSDCRADGAMVYLKSAGEVMTLEDALDRVEQGVDSSTKEILSGIEDKLSEINGTFTEYSAEKGVHDSSVIESLLGIKDGMKDSSVVSELETISEKIDDLKTLISDKMDANKLALDSIATAIGKLYTATKI